MVHSVRIRVGEFWMEDGEIFALALQGGKQQLTPPKIVAFE